MRFKDFYNQYEQVDLNQYFLDQLVILGDSKVLEEKTFEIDEDVEFIFNNGGMKEMLQAYRDDPKVLLNARLKFKEFGELDSSQLTNLDSKMAHIVKPIKIITGFGDDFGSAYSPSKNELYLSVSSSAVFALGSLGLDNKGMIADEPVIVTEFDDDRKKRTIAHELTHWLEDALFKDKMDKAISKLTKTLDKTKDRATREKIIKIFRVTSSQEIESFVSEVKRFKKEFFRDGGTQEGWDDLSFNEATKNRFVMHFKNLPQQIGEEASRIFVKQFALRLSREGLLGKSMRTIIKV